jgi:hypothetical protein
VPELMENPFTNWTNQAIHSELTRLLNLARSKTKVDSLLESATQLHAEVSSRKASKAPDDPNRWLQKSEFLNAWLLTLISRDQKERPAG